MAGLGVFGDIIECFLSNAVKGDLKIGVKGAVPLYAQCNGQTSSTDRSLGEVAQKLA